MIETHEATRQEWRELGFFYDTDDEVCVWRLTGSRAGLIRFKAILLSYAADPRHGKEFEHHHYGPYSYLKVMTGHKAGFDARSIHGTLEDLVRVAGLVEAELLRMIPVSSLVIHDEFAVDSPYALVLDLREDGFAPATADPLLADSDL